MNIDITPKLLSHPWYRAWECGALPVESLRHYAQEYYWQVANFPRYLSLLHSQIDDLGSRQVILENLQEEENRKAPHPELWLDFAEALGLNRAEITSSQPSLAAQALVNEFRAIVGSSPEAGLGAILAYESQVPEVAKFKTDALNKFYLQGEKAEKGTRFFNVHKETDIWHTEALETLVEKLPQEKKALAQEAANKACTALWKFLDAMPN